MSVRKLGLMLGCVMALHACNDAAQSEDDAPAVPPSTETPSATEVDAPPAELEADTDNTGAVRQADSHVHGEASLAVVLDGNVLTIELESPLYNLIGFEHAPETEEQVETIEQAEAVLAEPSKLVKLSGDAECMIDVSELDVHLMEGEHHKVHDHDDHDEHDHEDDGHEDHGDDDAHDHEEHADDEHDHDEHADHKDALITYEFTCQNPDQLKAIDVTLMAEFPNMTELEVVYLGPNSQELIELTPTNTRVTLGE